MASNHLSGRSVALPARRRFLRCVAAAGVTTATASFGLPAIGAGTPIRLGYVSPRSGPLAAFSAADDYVIGNFLDATKRVGVSYEVITKDTQSNPNRAAEVARELVVEDEVHLMLATSTPETTNPVATVCEAEEVPCITTLAPWQPWFVGQQANPADPSSWQGFDYAYHFFWGLEDITAVFVNLWSRIETNRTVGGLFPNDADGNAWGDPSAGFPPVLAERGFELIDPGRYRNLTDDFSAQVNAFKSGDAEIVTGVMIPPDFTTFWTQARQQGYTPKAASIGKAILFPQSVQALGEGGHNLSSEVWWSPRHPFTSSLTGESCEAIAKGFTEATDQPWTQFIGFVHALFEVAHHVMSAADDPADADAITARIAGTSLDTLVGPVAWPGQGLPPFAQANVAKTPLVGGQWRLQDGGAYDLVIVDNTSAPQIPTAGEMEAIT